MKKIIQFILAFLLAYVVGHSMAMADENCNIYYTSSFKTTDTFQYPVLFSGGVPALYSVSNKCQIPTNVKSISILASIEDGSGQYSSSTGIAYPLNNTYQPFGGQPIQFVVNGSAKTGGFLSSFKLYISPEYQQNAFITFYGVKFNCGTGGGPFNPAQCKFGKDDSKNSPFTVPGSNKTLGVTSPGYVLSPIAVSDSSSQFGTTDTSQLSSNNTITTTFKVGLISNLKSWEVLYKGIPIYNSTTTASIPPILYEYNHLTKIPSGQIEPWFSSSFSIKPESNSNGQIQIGIIFTAKNLGTKNAIEEGNFSKITTSLLSKHNSGCLVSDPSPTQDKYSLDLQWYQNNCDYVATSHSNIIPLEFRGVTDAGRIISAMKYYRAAYYLTSYSNATPPQVTKTPAPSIMFCEVDQNGNAINSSNNPCIGN